MLRFSSRLLLLRRRRHVLVLIPPDPRRRRKGRRRRHRHHPPSRGCPRLRRRPRPRPHAIPMGRHHSSSPSSSSLTPAPRRLHAHGRRPTHVMLRGNKRPPTRWPWHIPPMLLVPHLLRLSSSSSSSSSHPLPRLWRRSPAPGRLLPRRLPLLRRQVKGRPPRDKHPTPRPPTSSSSSSPAPTHPRRHGSQHVPIHDERRARGPRRHHVRAMGGWEVVVGVVGMRMLVLHMRPTRGERPQMRQPTHHGPAPAPGARRQHHPTRETRRRRGAGGVGTGPGRGGGRGRRIGARAGQPIHRLPHLGPYSQPKQLVAKRRQVQFLARRLGVVFPR